VGGPIAELQSGPLPPMRLRPVNNESFVTASDEGEARALDAACGPVSQHGRLRKKILWMLLPPGERAAARAGGRDQKTPGG
jgi:hypothetical protein